MTIQFNTGIESLDRLQFKSFPTRNTKASTVVRIHYTCYAVFGTTVYSSDHIEGMGSKTIYRPTLAHRVFAPLADAAIAMGLVDKAEVHRARQQLEASKKARIARHNAILFSDQAQQAGIKLTTKQQRHVDMAKAASAELDGGSK